MLYDKVFKSCAVNEWTEGQELHRARVETVAGAEYFVVSDGLKNAVGEIQLNWALGIAPEVLNEYEETEVTQGTRVLLEAWSGEAVPEPSFQWWQNGQAIAGATNTTLDLGWVGRNQEGIYAVEVSNVIGRVNRIVRRIEIERPEVVLWRDPFDAGIEGWRLDASLGQLSHRIGEGNPGGCLWADGFPINGAWHWVAPTDLSARLAQGYSGWLEFDIKDGALEPGSEEAALVELVGAGLKIVFSEFLPPVPLGNGWRKYRIPLRADPPFGEGLWLKQSNTGSPVSEAEMRSVLGNLNQLRIRGIGKVGQEARLDNVTVTLIAPVLNIEQYDGEVMVFSWQSNGPTFLLQAADCLDGCLWIDNPPLRSMEVNDGMIRVEVELNNGTRFFRLTLPP